MKIIIFLLSLGILLATITAFTDFAADAKKSEGRYHTEVDSKKVCGDRLCSESIPQPEKTIDEPKQVVKEESKPEKIPDIIEKSENKENDLLHMMFVQTAISGTFSEKDERKILTLSQVSPTTVWFSDKPDRKIGHKVTELFALMWNENAYSFVENPPDASLYISNGVQGDTFFLELTNPNYDHDSETLQYDVDTVLPEAFSQVVLFIEKTGKDCTPEPKKDLSGCDLSEINLSGADLSGTNMNDVDLVDANLRNANLSGADLNDARLFSANLSGANLSGANLSGVDLFSANLGGAELSDVNLSGVDLDFANLSDANLIGANLSDASLDGASLSGADLVDANLSGSKLNNSNLSDANLRNANLSGADLVDANLSSANLSGAILSGTDLDFANLIGADLTGAKLIGAKLFSANLSDVDLSSANLSGADLNDANLGGANLRNANLSGADLSDANLNGADLSDAKTDNCIGCP